MANLFAKQANAYSLGRSIYPKSFISYLTPLTPSHSVAWDVGTGNGQAAVALAEHYEKVIATDVSDQQIKHAVQLPNITYEITSPHMTDDQVRSLIGDDGCVDLVTCAQALHWFDLDDFYRQVRLVLRNPGGVIAAWAYRDPSVSPSVDAVLSNFQHTNSQEWAPQISYIKESYKTIPFPFAPVIRSIWQLQDLLILSAQKKRLLLSICRTCGRGLRSSEPLTLGVMCGTSISRGSSLMLGEILPRGQ